MRVIQDGILVYRFISMAAYDCDGKEAPFSEARMEYLQSVTLPVVGDWNGW